MTIPNTTANLTRHFFFGTDLQLPEDLPLETAEQHCGMDTLLRAGQVLRNIPVDRIFGVLERTGQLLTDPAGPYLPRIMETMPEITGYSAPMVRRGMELLGEMLTRPALEARLAFLGNYHILDHHIAHQGRALRALPLGSVCHIAAGNIFIGSVDSLVLGMISKNVNLLKISRQDPIFPFLFLDALREADPEGDVASSVGITSWSRTNEPVIAHIKQIFSGILLFGGEEAVREYKRNLGPQTELLSFGPKISFGVIRRGLTQEELREAARGFALDASLWEQRACTSCQNIFVEGDAAPFTELLGEEMEKLSRNLPRGAVQPDEAVEIRREKELAFWRSARGENTLREGKDWTIITNSSADVIPSPLNRTVFVNSVENFAQILEGNLKVMEWYMSTAGVAAPAALVEDTLEDLMTLGVLRFCKPGTMGLGDDPSGAHDGTHIPLRLVRLTNPEDLSADLLWGPYGDPHKEEGFLLERLNRILDYAVKAPFYAEKLQGISLPLRSLEEYTQIPPLEKEELSAHCPPEDHSMVTGPSGGAYAFASGGTSGQPRFTLWSKEEFAEAGKITGEGFRALGITPEDTVANLVHFGGLYTGYMAFNAGLEETGCSILSLGFNQEPSEILHHLERFRPTGVTGMSSDLMALAKAADLEKSDLIIPKIYFTGEPLPRAGQEYIRRVFRCTALASSLYGAVEIGPMGYQCPSCGPGEFHVHSGWCHVEILEDGNVLGTTLERTLHPILRYRLGDLAEWVDTPCPCGRKAPKFRLLGRSADFVRLRYCDLFLREVYAALEPFGEVLSSDFQITVEEEGPEKLLVTLAVEILPGRTVPEDLPEAVAQSVRENFQELREYGAGDFVRFAVEPVEPGSLERVERTGKIRRIRDKRL